MIDERDIKWPDKVLLEFATELPPLVRDVVMARCLVGFGMTNQMRPGADIVELFKTLFNKEHRVDRVYRVAMLCGMMDLAVQFDEDHDKFMRELADQHPDMGFETMALQAPLKTRHFLAARAQFAELREGTLSPLALQLWSNFLLAKGL